MCVRVDGCTTHTCKYGLKSESKYLTGDTSTDIKSQVPTSVKTKLSLDLTSDVNLATWSSGLSAEDAGSDSNP